MAVEERLGEGAKLWGGGECALAQLHCVVRIGIMMSWTIARLGFDHGEPRERDG